MEQNLTICDEQMDLEAIMLREREEIFPSSSNRASISFKAAT